MTQLYDIFLMAEYFWTPNRGRLKEIPNLSDVKHGSFDAVLTLLQTTMLQHKTAIRTSKRTQPALMSREKSIIILKIFRNTRTHWEVGSQSVG
jgi:hypothetical protein